MGGPAGRPKAATRAWGEPGDLGDSGRDRQACPGLSVVGGLGKEGGPLNLAPYPEAPAVSGECQQARRAGHPADDQRAIDLIDAHHRRPGAVLAGD